MGASRDSIPLVGMEEVVTALAKLRPSGSMIRIACWWTNQCASPLRRGRAIAR